MAQQQFNETYSNEPILEELLSSYQVLVYSLARHLTGSEHQAKQVVETVFVKLPRTLRDNNDEPIEELIHRLTYDAALPLLLENVLDKSEEQGEVVFDLSQQRLVC